MRLKLVVIGILLITFIFILSFNKSNKIKEKHREIKAENTIQNQEIKDSKEVNIQESVISRLHRYGVFYWNVRDSAWRWQDKLR